MLKFKKGLDSGFAYAVALPLGYSSMVEEARFELAITAPKAI